MHGARPTGSARCNLNPTLPQRAAARGRLYTYTGSSGAVMHREDGCANDPITPDALGSVWTQLSKAKGAIQSHGAETKAGGSGRTAAPQGAS
jgi:hypothetical protein